MKYIIISGIDGSGKTTIINNLKLRIEKNGDKVQYFWMRYNHYFVKPLHALARIVGLSKKYKGEEGYAWRHEFYKSPLFSFIYIFFTYIDTIIGRIKLNLSQDKTSTYILCDRWVSDVLIDLGTKTHNLNFLNTKWYNRFNKILPKNSVQFVIIRDQDKLLECRLENREDPDFKFRTLLYQEILKKPEITCINNNTNIEDAVNSILKIIK